MKLIYYGASKAKSSITRRFWAYLIVSSWIIQSGFAQQKLDQLLVYGDNFLFSVKEPPGWIGDTKNAQKFGSNVILRESGQPPNSFSGLIRIRVNDKTDENISADLEEDMRSYRVQYPRFSSNTFP